VKRKLHTFLWTAISRRGVLECVSSDGKYPIRGTREGIEVGVKRPKKERITKGEDLVFFIQ